MKNKVSILIIAIFLTIVLFCISTYMQKKIINYEPKTRCFVAATDIEANEKMLPEKMREIEIEIPIVMNMKIVQDISTLDNLYARSKVYAGQILVKNQFDTKENLSIFEGEAGKEKIAIKIKNAENSVSYRIREKSKVNVYATLRAEYSNNVFPDAIRQYIGNENDGFCTIKILNEVTVLGVFDNFGMQVHTNSEEYIPDTIMISVTPEEARDINLIRDIATFNVTELEEDNKVESTLN